MPVIDKGKTAYAAWFAKEDIKLFNCYGRKFISTRRANAELIYMMCHLITYHRNAIWLRNTNLLELSPGKTELP